MRNVLKTLALAVTGALSLTSAAMAGEVRVAYGDLDIRQPAGAAQLDQRIQKAAGDWCQANPNRGRATLDNSVTSCRRQVSAELRRVMPRSERESLRMAAKKAQTVQLAAR